MMTDRYLGVLNAYKLWFPNLYNRTVDCWQTDIYTLLATLDDGSRIEFNSRTNAMRDVTGLYSTGVNEMDEESWRKEFGRHLRRAITDKGITQERLADMSGISRQMMTRYIRGLSTPSGYILSKLTEILECDARELTGFGSAEEWKEK